MRFTSRPLLRVTSSLLVISTVCASYRFLAIGKFSDPPRATDLEGFNFDSDDIKPLKDCEPGDCEVQMPAEGIQNIYKSVNWSAAPAEIDRQGNRQLHQRVIEGGQAYRRHGNQALGVDVDKKNPTDVPQQFEYMLATHRRGMLFSSRPSFNR